MTIEVFTQLTASGDQLEQQYKLRQRFCVDYLGWKDRTSVNGMEYDEYDHPAAIYIIWRDKAKIARGMARITPCSLPYMISDNWPHLVTDKELARANNQWEVTRFCVERVIADKIGEVIFEIFSTAEEIAKLLGIDEYWWIGPKERINTILPHNHVYVGPGQQIGDEMCFVGYSYAQEMVIKSQKHRVKKVAKYKIPQVAA